MLGAGTPQPLQAVGHSAGGPCSVGAVYHFPPVAIHRTMAAFAAGVDEGVPEAETLRYVISRPRYPARGES